MRVLGCLLEKQRTTPEVYPLSLNAIRLACNQATSRDPVVDYREPTVRAALDRLTERGWAGLARSPGGRVAKYRQLFDKALELDPAQTALLAVLMLRGAQTPGELKSRSERLHPVGSLEDVDRTLVDLIERRLVARLLRRPGQKEERYTQLLGSADAGDGEVGDGEAGGVDPAVFEPKQAIRALHQTETGLLERGSVLDLLAENIEWHVAGRPTDLPWAGVSHGIDGVRRWIETLDQHLDYDRFELGDLFADDETVVELIFASGRARASQRPFESEVVRIWTFERGKAVLVRSYYDTAAYARAFGG